MFLSLSFSFSLVFALSLDILVWFKSAHERRRISSARSLGLILLTAFIARLSSFGTPRAAKGNDLA